MQNLSTATAQVIPFRFETREVRTLLIGDQPWFVANDVSAALQYSEASAMTRHLDDDEKGLSIVQTLGGDQEMLVINESGLYSAILRSRKAEAKRFKKWVTAEVLPAIRKHGRYVDSNNRMDTLIGQTIGTFGFNCLAAVLDGKVRHLPAKLRVGAKNHVWSQVRKAFSVSAVEEIPGSAMDSVRTFIAAYALEGEWLPRSEKAAAFADLIGRQLGASERWLVYTDGNGAEHYQQVPISAGVMTQQGFIEGLCRGDLPMKTAEMFDVLMSTLMHLKLRTEHQQRQLQLVP